MFLIFSEGTSRLVLGRPKWSLETLETVQDLFWTLVDNLEILGTPICDELHRNESHLIWNKKNYSHRILIKNKNYSIDDSMMNGSWLMAHAEGTSLGPGATAGADGGRDWGGRRWVVGNK